MSQTVLVTGGNGFIGGWCAAELLKRGYAVRTTVRGRAKEESVRTAIARAGAPADLLECITADLRADEGWDAAVAGCDYVLHVASPLGAGGVLNANADLNAFVEPARNGTLRVLRAAITARVKRVVMTSAAATARPPLDSNRISDETVWADPADPQFDFYRVSKILAERAAWDLIGAQNGQTEFTAILPGAVFGPVLDADNLGSAKVIGDLLRGRPPVLPQIGFWVIDVRDLVDLHIRAMTSADAAGQRFLAAGDFMWMEDIARVLRANLGGLAKKVTTRRLPNLAVKLMLPFLPQFKTLAPLLGHRYPLTSDKARKVLGFAPRAATTTIVDCARSLLPAQ